MLKYYIRILFRKTAKILDQSFNLSIFNFKTKILKFPLLKYLSNLTVTRNEAATEKFLF